MSRTTHKKRLTAWGGGYTQNKILEKLNYYLILILNLSLISYIYNYSF
jgi:hypothetical protein